MHAFKDNAGRNWTVAVTVGSVKRVRSMLNVDLLDAAEGKVFARLATDPVLLCDVLYCVCKPDLDAAGVTDEQFGEALAGDAIEHATEALLEDLVDFFPKARRQVLAKALGKLRTLETRAAELAMAKFDSPELDRELDRILQESGSPATNSPPSQVQTQNPEHSGN